MYYSVVKGKAVINLNESKEATLEKIEGFSVGFWTPNIEIG